MLTTQEIAQLIERARSSSPYQIMQSPEQVLQSLSEWVPPAALIQSYENICKVVEHTLIRYGSVSPELLTSVYNEIRRELPNEFKCHVVPTAAPAPIQQPEPVPVEKKRDALGPAVAADKPIPMVQSVSESNTAIFDSADYCYHRKNYKNALLDFRLQARREAPVINGMLDLSFVERRFNELKNDLDKQIENAQKQKKNREQSPAELDAVVEKLRREADRAYRKGRIF